MKYSLSSWNHREDRGSTLISVIDIARQLINWFHRANPCRLEGRSGAPDTRNIVPFSGP